MDVAMTSRVRNSNTFGLTLTLDQLKRVYVALFCRLQTGGCTAFADIDQDDLLLDIQTQLQHAAAEQGVDCTDHAAWEAFLGITHPASCPRRGHGIAPDDTGPRPSQANG